ncbi:hypothetical protein GCM10029964_114700 [Kibdelosporangium lantanae]
MTITLVLTSSSSGRTIAQFDYSFDLPSGWTQVSATTETREVQIRPEGATTGTDAVVVQELALNFDATSDRAKALADLHAKYEKATQRLSDLDDNTTFAGRQVVHYRQTVDQATVDWFVLFQGHAQVSIGCQYTTTGRDHVLEACDHVVRTMKVEG